MWLGFWERPDGVRSEALPGLRSETWGTRRYAGENADDGRENAMNNPDPERIDDENPEWTEETFAKAISFSALPSDLQELLASLKQVAPDAETSSKRKPAA